MDIEFKDFEKYYGNQKIISINNLFLDGGKVYCLMGRNGAGKSTLLKILANIDHDYKGKISFYNKGNQCFDIRKYITMVSQKPYIFNATVRENIEYGLKARNLPLHEIKYRVSKCLRKMDLEKYASKNALKLSGGEMQRLALARAIVFEPSLLLLDEPTSNADEEYKQLMNEVILNINRAFKTTVIMVTHDEAQLHKVGGALISMKDSKIKLTKD